MLLTGAGIVPLLNKSFNGDRRWSFSHSTHPRRLTWGATASFKCQPQQKGVQPAPIAQAIEVKQACVKPAFSSLHLHDQHLSTQRSRQREGRRCVYAMSTVGEFGIILVSCVRGTPGGPEGCKELTPVGPGPLLSAVGDLPLIYRGNQIIAPCLSCKTVSDKCWNQMCVFLNANVHHEHKKDVHTVGTKLHPFVYAVQVVAGHIYSHFGIQIIACV